MANEYLPRADAKLAQWSAHFAAAIAAGDYGQSARQTSDYLAGQSRYATALRAAIDPDTRGGSTVLAKSLARRELEILTRQLVRLIQANPAVSDQQRYDLGLTVRKAPTPVAVPARAPGLDLLSMTGHRMRVRLHNAAAAGRGKPAGVSGATLCSFVGPTPPAQITRWTFRQNTGRAVAELDFDAALAPGTRVWVTVC